MIRLTRPDLEGLVENAQRSDGSIAIPEALQSHFGAAEIAPDGTTPR